MGCSFCKPNKIKRTQIKPKLAKLPPPQKSSINNQKISLDVMRSIYRKETPTNEINKKKFVPKLLSYHHHSTEKITVKRIMNFQSENRITNDITEKEKFFSESFREFKRNGFNKVNYGEKKEKEKKPKTRFLQNYDALLHNKINSSSFKSKEFLKVMPSSFLQRSKEMGSTIITSEMIENELRRSAISRKGRQRYYKSGNNKYDTFKKSHFRKTFELQKLKELLSMGKIVRKSGEYKRKTGVVKNTSLIFDVKNTGEDQNNIDERIDFSGRRKAQKHFSMIELPKKKKEDEKVIEETTKKTTIKEEEPDQNEKAIDDYSLDYATSESSNLENNEESRPQTLHSLYNIEEKCQVFELSDGLEDENENDSSIILEKASFELDDDSNQNAIELGEGKEVKVSMEQEFLEDDSSSSEEQEKEIEITKKEGEEMEVRGSESSSSDEEYQDLSMEKEEELEDLDGVIGKEDTVDESSFDIDVPLSQDSIYQGDYGLKRD